MGGLANDLANKIIANRLIFCPRAKDTRRINRGKHLLTLLRSVLQIHLLYQDKHTPNCQMGKIAIFLLIKHHFNLIIFKKMSKIVLTKDKNGYIIIKNKNCFLRDLCAITLIAIDGKNYSHQK